MTAGSPLIEDTHDLSGGTGDRLVHVPDTATALVFRTTADGSSDLVVVGPRTRAAYFAGKDLPVCVRARLRPGTARPLLGVPISALVDRTMPLAELWGGSAPRLERRLARLDGDRGLILQHLDTALRARADEAEVTRRDGLVRVAAEALSTRRSARLVDLARHLGVSERHLRDLLTEGAGLTPKSYARIARIRAALTHGRSPGLARLAADTGYYDQAHMTAEFHTMMGVPPGAFFAGRLPALQPC